MPLGDGDLAPDRIPDWLQEQVRKSKGRNLDDFGMLDEFYKETQVVESDRFDRMHYKTMRKKADELDDLAKSRHVDKPTWEDIVEDEFLGLYKAVPKTRGEKEMKPTHKVNHAAMTRASDTREWNELRTYTELDDWSAAMAAVEFGLRLSEIFDEMEELAKLQKGMDESDQEVADAIAALKGLDEELGDAEALLDALQEALDDYGEQAEAMGQGVKEHSNQIRQAARQAAKEAKEDAEGAEALLDSFGTEPGALKKMDAAARMELAARIRSNPTLKELAEKVGRFVRLALAEQAQKIVHGIDEVHDIELGNDIHKVLPSELMNLSDPDLEILFLKDFAEGNLLQYQLRGVEKVARGAIICMIDSSGSMMGSRETWAKAVGIALLHIAYKQKRDFYGIIFSSAHDPLIEFSFPKGRATPAEVLDFAESSYHGGTDFMAPINRAVEVLEGQFNNEGSMKGDFVFITDGESYVTDEWLDRYQNAKDELAFRMYSCLIGANSTVLQTISDQIYHITELARGSDVQEIFGFV